MIDFYSTIDSLIEMALRKKSIAAADATVELATGEKTDLLILVATGNARARLTAFLESEQELRHVMLGEPSEQVN